MSSTTSNARLPSRLLWVARALGRAFRPTSHLKTTGRRFRCLWESRGNKADRDYPVLVALARGKRCVYDVGSNQGVTSLLIADVLHPEGWLIAFDAAEAACQVTQHNLELNGFGGKSQVVNTVVSSSDQQLVPFYSPSRLHDDGTSGGASTIRGYLGHHSGLLKASISLDGFARSEAGRKAGPPELVKIDVEGAELEVLRGASRLLEENHPLLLVELHSWQELSVAGTAAEILQLLPSLGYEMVYLRDRRPIRDPSVLETRGRCHVLLLPAGDPQPEVLDHLDTSTL